MSRGARRKPASARATREPTHTRIAGESTTVVPAAAGPETYAPAGPWTRARLAALFFLLLVAGVYAASIPTSAIDTWTALGEGRYVLEHGVDDSDPFSFNSRPTAASLLPLGASPVRRAWAWLCPTGWINQNWLAEVVLIELYKAGGTDALFAWHILDLAGVAALIALAGWVRGANRELALVIAAAALLPGRMYYEIRAQDMTDLLAAALILLLALAARRSPRWIWLAVPLLAVWGNVHGGFVWGLMALAVWLGAAILTRFLPAPVSRFSAADIRRTAVGAALAVAATVIASPYRIGNLLHPLLISVSKDAKFWREVGEWHPLKDSSLGEIATFVAFVACTFVAVFFAIRRGAERQPGRARGATERLPAAPEGGWDLGATAVFAMTAAMAVTSRRFLPMAYLVGAPLLAECATRALQGRSRLRRIRQYCEPRQRQVTVLVVAGVLLVTATTATSFARTFLGPWPHSFSHVSPGDRVLDRSSRPWGPCRFLALNGVRGRLWTFYEDAGFWNWCQQREPTDGRTPLQVFIDPRAQRAFDVSVFLSYHNIAGGGPTAKTIDDAGRAPNPEEARAIEGWLARTMTAEGMWIVALPPEGRDTAFARYLPQLPAWRTVYLDEDHTLLVDTANPAGRDLAARADRDTLVFPNEASHLLTRAALALQADDAASWIRGLTLAEASYRAMPSARAVVYVGAAARRGEGRAEAVRFCRGILDDLNASRPTYSRSDGYGRRLAAAIEAADIVREYSGGDVAVMRWASEQLLGLTSERERVVAATGQ